MDHDAAAPRRAGAELGAPHQVSPTPPCGTTGHGSRWAGGPSRRQLLLRAGLATTVVSIAGHAVPLGGLWTSALAATDEEGADAQVAAFAASVEFAVAQVYDTAIGSGKLAGPAVEALRQFATHHRAHGDAFVAASGGRGNREPQASLVRDVTTKLEQAPDQPAVLEVAFDVENALAATYLWAVSALTTRPARVRAATVLPVEAGHAVVVGRLLGHEATTADFLPKFQTDDGRIDPVRPEAG